MGREEDEAVARAYADAWRRGDAAAVVALYHDAIVLHYSGRSPLAGDHVGKPAALAALAKIQQLTNRQPVAIHDIMTGDEHTAILAKERWERDGKVLDLDRVFLYHIRDGKFVECWAYDDDQRAVDEFWS
jgi:uncharacterized protein